MTNINLVFSCPILFEELVTNQDAYNPGIYIWGFKHPNPPGNFIPYYVGKSLSSVVSRIAQHKKDILKTDSTYIRFSCNFMKKFYVHKDLEKLSRPGKSQVNIPNWYKNGFNNIEIEYLNTLWFIQQKNPGYAKNSNYPISLITPPPFDYLKTNINSIWICWSIPSINEQVIANQTNDFYEYLEAITKQSLKGKTLGKKEKSITSGTQFQINNLQYNVDISYSKCIEHIFKTGVNKKVFPGSEFNGY